jgi:hypothetical protein
MKYRTDPHHALVALGLLATLSNCQIINKLTGRNDSGTRSQNVAPILSDSATPPPAIGLPNPNISPLANQNVPDESPDAGMVAEADAGAMGAGDAGDPNANGTTIAVVDAGTTTELTPNGRRTGGGPGYRTYCKTHPGMINPYTGVLCPQVFPGVIIR